MVRRCSILLATLLATLALPAGAFAIVVDHDSASVVETTPGGDGVLGPGDTFSLTEALHTSDPALTGVAGALTSSTPGVSIAQGTSPWPDLQFGIPASNTTPFQGSVSSSADCGVNLDFDVRLHTDQGDAVVPFSAPTGRAGPARPFDSVDVPKPINDNATITSSFAVPTPGRVKGLRVRIGRITHTYVGDLRIELIAPDGTRVQLIDQRGESGDNLVDTVFDSSAATPISAGTAPFDGTFRPEESLNAFDGHEQQGTWTLKVSDLRAPDTGTLDAWGADVAFAVCSGDPVAAFVATPNPALPGESVLLDGSGSVDPDGSIVRYEWDLDGDGSFETDGGTSPTLQTSFGARGRYPVGLRVTDNGGHTGEYSLDVAVTHPPTASLVATPDTAATGETVGFDASASSDPDGPIARYEWDFDGDGTFETDGGSTPTITHAFDAPGDVAVHVRVTDTEGATATATQVVHVTNSAPTAAFTPPSPVVAGHPAVFDASASSDPDGTVVDYAWDFDGDGVFETAGGGVPSVTHVFALPGTYVVGLRVTDDSGATATATASVDVTQPPLAALVVSPSAVHTGDPVAFDASGSSDTDGSIVRYEWDLDGNGSYEADTAGDPHATRTYPNHGVIPVRVRVTDDDGATDVATATLTVSDPPPAPGTGSGGGSGSGSGSGSSSSSTTAGSSPGTATGGDAAATSGAGGGSSSGPADGSAAVANTPPGPLRASLDGPAVQKARTVARSGVQVACSTDRPATCALRAEVGAATAKRLGLRVKRRVKTVAIGSASVQAQAGTPGAAAIKLSARVAKRLKRARGIAVTVRATITAASGEQAEAVRAIAVRR